MPCRPETRFTAVERGRPLLIRSCRSRSPGSDALQGHIDLLTFYLETWSNPLDLQHASGDFPLVQKTELEESAALIARKGNEHERAYLDRLRAEGRAVVDIAVEGGSTDDKVARTLAAMRSGVEVIYRATLRDGPLFGHADFLLRVDGEPSALGDWRYEVADTKLARSPKAKFLVQLAFYSRLLALAQDAEPKRMHVVLGDQTRRSFRCADYMHYFNALLARFRGRVQALVAGGPAGTYGLPCGYCDLCHWRERCEPQRIADDHLCQVANIRLMQWSKLQDASIDTMAKLAAVAPHAVIPRLNPDTFTKLQSQLGGGSGADIALSGPTRLARTCTHS